MNKVLEYLDNLLPDAFCELNYNKDYELLIAVMLSAQTTDIRVNKVTSELFNKYNSLEELSIAKISDVISVIKTLGNFNKKANNIIQISKSVLNMGYVPNNRDYLESLPGVGRKTANVVLSILYNEPYMAVDTHVTRVSVRLGLVNYIDSVLEIEKKLTKSIPTEKISKVHHQMVLFGRYYCKARNPECEKCGLKSICKYKKNED